MLASCRRSIALALFAVGAAAQTPTGVPAVDSSAVARNAWSAAVRASRQNDTLGAKTNVDRAAQAWPTQQSYVWGRAAIAAQRNDTATVRSALEAYANLGLGRDLNAERSLAPFRSLPWFSAMAARHESNRAPLANSLQRATLPDSAFWPEGVDYNPKTQSFYVTSVRHRTLAEVRPDGSVRELWARHLSGMGSILAVRIAPSRSSAWVTMSGLTQMEGYQPADSALAALLEVRLSDGKILRRYDLPVGRHHTLGDVAIAADGSIIATDSEDPAVYVLRPGATTLVAIRHPLLRSPQGIAPTNRAGVAYVADYSHGILRIDLATQRVTRVEDAANSTSLGVDGLTWYRNTLIGIQNGVSPARVVQFALDATGERFTKVDVLDRNPVADEPTIGTLVGDTFVYVANSQWEKYTEDGKPRGALLTRPVLLAVPLKH